MPDLDSPPLEVTIVAHDIEPVGGMELQLTKLVSGLLAAGDRVTVVSRTCWLEPDSNLRWIRVPGPSRPFAIAFPWYMLVASLLIILRGRGVLHSTGAIVLNRTAICTVHYCHQETTLPGFSRSSRSNLAYRLNEKVAEQMKRLAERWCYRPHRTERMVGVSEGVARELRRHFSAMQHRVTMIPNGVDTDVFRPSEATPSPEARSDLKALFVGSEWARKGLSIAIEALHDSPATSLTVVGSGDVSAYRKLAERIGVDNRVSFVGPTDDVASWYRRADVFLLPTAYETFSLVTFEAAASGLPLLVTKVNGVEDLIREGANGWFISRDPKGISERLNELRDKPQLRGEMGAAARADSFRYSWVQVVEDYRGLYLDSTRSVMNSAT